jgi:hypothetical protein
VENQNHIEHILRDRRRHLSVIDVRSFRAADWPKVRVRLAVNKQRSHGFHMERLNLKKLYEIEGKEKYHVEVSNRFTALADLDTKRDVNFAWETIRKNIQISAK